MLWLQQLHVGAIANTGEELRPFDPQNAANAFLNIYRCGDGEWIALGMTAMNTHDWHTFCDAIGRPYLKEDERYARNRGRIEHASELVVVISDAMASRPRDEWLAVITEVGLPCGPVRHLREVIADPQVLADNVLTRTPSGMSYVRAPFNTDGVAVTSSDAPDYAADTFAVLSEAGLSAEEISALQAGEVIW
jgi:formyl-CoA transferase